MGTIDLHMHSAYSLDGQLSPGELAARAAGAGLSAMALTDHNSVRGLEEAGAEAEQRGITFVPGVEMDCQLNGKNLHLLGYGVNSAHPAFREIEEEILDRERICSGSRLQFFHSLGLVFDDDRVRSQNAYGLAVAEDIAREALEEPANRDSGILAPYRPGGARSGNPYVNFYWDFASQGKPGYTQIHYRSFEEINRMILDQGGITVIAHPDITVGRNREALGYMARCGLGGIEVYCSYHGPGEQEYYRETARSLGLAVTAGSDFHGRSKPSVVQGGTGAGEMQEREIREDLAALGILL